MLMSHASRGHIGLGKWRAQRGGRLNPILLIFLSLPSSKSMIENLIFQEHAENLCYCKQREDRGVKDVFQVEFMIKSKLYISDMSYTMSEFGRQKSMLEKSVDEMILRNLNESVVKPAGFVRSQVMQVRETIHRLSQSRRRPLLGPSPG